MKLLHVLWNDEFGAVVSAELVMVMTILVIGLVVGLATVRDAVISELADVGAAIGHLNQSYSFSTPSGHGMATAGSLFGDHPDHCDDCDSSGTVVGISALRPNSQCVNLCTTPPQPECTGGTTTN